MFLIGLNNLIFIFIRKMKGIYKNKHNNNRKSTIVYIIQLKTPRLHLLNNYRDL